MSERTCEAVDCLRPAMPRGRWCTTHHTRVYRHGSAEWKPQPRKVGSVSHHGYRRIGDEYEHRMVLRAVIGEAPHPCAWCNRMLTWDVDLQADHLDGDRLNNDPRNLVPACLPCNTGRVFWLRRTLPHCPNGHGYTPENTYMDPRGTRQCKTCRREKNRKWWAENGVAWRASRRA